MSASRPAKVAGMRISRLGGFPTSDEVLLGELANRLQHGVSGPPRGPLGDQQRLAHQGVEQIQRRVLVEVIGSGYRTSAFKVETAREHRTPCQQFHFGVVEQVVGPRHRMAQRMVMGHAAPGAD